MTQQNNIIPPSELVQQWEEDWHHGKVTRLEFEPYIAAQAAQWGADQELEACCKVLNKHNPSGCWSELLRSNRCPKPPSLKQQALEELDLTADPNGAELSSTQVELIRRALEQLND